MFISQLEKQQKFTSQQLNQLIRKQQKVNVSQTKEPLLKFGGFFTNLYITENIVNNAENILFNKI